MQTWYRHSPCIGLVDLCYKLLQEAVALFFKLRRTGCFDKHFIVEKAIDQNDFQCRYRLSLGLELDLDVEINRSNAGADLRNTHTPAHINQSSFSDLTIVVIFFFK